MNQGQYVFSQLVSHLDRNNFNYLAREYGENKYVVWWKQVREALFMLETIACNDVWTTLKS